MNKEQLEIKVREVAEKMELLGIPVSHHIEEVDINSRTRSRLGACRRRKNLMGEDVFTIEISQKVLGCLEKDLCSIIAHELLHTCQGCFNHGKKWKSMTYNLERSYGWSINRTMEYQALGIKKPDTLEKVKYTLACKNCGHIYIRRRMCPLVRTPEKYRCGKCGGNLKLEEKSTISSG